MARRSDHSREELFELAIAAARKCAERDGLKGITARNVAHEIGYSPGTLYNVFEDLDDLVTHLNGRTLEELSAALVGAADNPDPRTALRTLARRYIAFTRARPRLWSVLLEHGPGEDARLPESYYDKVRDLMGLVEKALAPLFSPRAAKRRATSARLLWSALHGICSLEGAGKLDRDETVESLVECLIEHHVLGLEAKAGR
ncbi:MAG: TetR-like C-terminal domain-containing protein [Alphaproteobacteria bacterium]|jgi:AcrR family transcriptional regulator|nr:TetR-like C-terminal domain-containing protein [Alphaproteobacteria bacterium]